MQTIYKFPIPKQADDYVLHTHKDAKFLSIQEQDSGPNSKLVLWAIVNTADPIISHTIELRFTGQPINFALYSKYIGTVQCSNGLVYHAFKSLVK